MCISHSLIQLALLWSMAKQTHFNTNLRVANRFVVSEMSCVVSSIVVVLFVLGSGTSSRCLVWHVLIQWRPTLAIDLIPTGCIEAQHIDQHGDAVEDVAAGTQRCAGVHTSVWWNFCKRLRPTHEGLPRVCGFATLTVMVKSLCLGVEHQHSRCFTVGNVKLCLDEASPRAMTANVHRCACTQTLSLPQL